MLHEFLTRERATILETAKRKAEAARWGRLSTNAIDQGWDIFYDELTKLCASCYVTPTNGSAGGSITRAGSTEYLKLGYAITEAVQSYNIIYQSIVESATVANYAIEEPDLKNLNLSLDTAIAQAVTQFERRQMRTQHESEVQRVGFLAHELRNSLQSRYDRTRDDRDR
jgi:hypothetical protein